MYLKIKNSRLLKGISVFSALNLMFQVFYPTAAYALTSGPSQPEVQSFEPITTNQMVNQFTGDFAYNIPLLSVPGPNGGYPINISYHSGITMDQEASWVGLGWNINPGVINRSVRGVPDDFNGAKIKKEYYTEPVSNMAFSGSFGYEAWAFDNLKGNIGAQLYSNSKTGVGLSFSASMNYTLLQAKSYSPSGGVGFDYDTQSGVGLTVNGSLDLPFLNLSGSYYVNKHGLQSKTLSFSSSNSGKFEEVTSIVRDRKKSNDNISYLKTGYKRQSGNKNISIGGSSTYHYGKNAFVPSSTFPSKSTKFSFFIGGGGLGMGMFGNAQFMYTQSETFLTQHEKLFDSYGYMYSENAADDALMDYTRESDGSLPHSLKNLPIPVFTNDVFSAYAQGMMTSFRPYRSDVGILHDPFMENNGNVGTMTGLEAAWGDGFQGGTDNTTSTITSHSGKWTNLEPIEPNSTDNFNNKYKFLKKTDLVADVANNEKDGSLYEPYYMKSTAEMSADYDTDPNYLQSEDAVHMAMTGSNDRPELGASVIDKKRGQRENRTQSSLIRTFKDINNTPVATYDILQHHDATTYEALAAAHPNANLMDQIAEITAFNSSGMRYVYGLPVFNNVKKDVVFSVYNPKVIPGQSPDGLLQASERLYQYTPEEHVKKENGKGYDEYFTRNTTPTYAYANLLTATYSPDYVDMLGDGPTEDDLGYYVKYDYEKVTGDYKWRAPFYAATHLPGFLSNYADDKATYTYGEKEIYVLKSIETKTHIAHFRTSVRNDAYGVSSEHQSTSLDTDPSENIGLVGQKKLDRIDLYSKADVNYNPNDDVQTIKPIKSVHFEYDYSLCYSVDNYIEQTVSNFDKGKLTLKKVFFTYGNSKRGALSPYQFEYSETNPDYETEGYRDRWGFYQSTPFSNNIDFPFVNQNESYSTDRHKNAAAWSLTNMKLPSGAEMNIEYEQDDYAYVQDKQAMQAVKIVGVGTESGIESSGKLDENLYVYFELDQDPELVTDSNLSPAALGHYMATEYVSGVNEVYFKAYVKMKNAPEGWDVVSEVGNHIYDYVEGYAQRDLGGSIGYKRETIDGVERALGYFKLKNVAIDSYEDEHPFQKAAIQHIKLRRQDLINAPENADDNFFVGGLEEIKNFFDDVEEFVKGYYKFAKTENYGHHILIDDNYPSVVRLNCGDGIKYGGGHRVSRLTINDQWDSMTSNSEGSFDYGQEYDYRLPDGKSSGVATYEPIVGNEENPFRKPDYQNPGDFIVKDDAAYNDRPIGEQYFPAPSVGYSRVAVHNIVRDEEKSVYGERLTEKTGSGKMVYEFYTNKDFPIRVSKSPIKNKNVRTEAKLINIGYKMLDNRAYSQGYAIHLNDMHGKPKANITYPENTVLFQTDQTDPSIDFVEPDYTMKESFFYDTEHEYSSNSPENRLDNKVKVLFPTGEKKQAYLGRTIEFFTETREDYRLHETIGLQLDGGVTTIPPSGPIPFVGLQITIDERTENLFRSVVTNKIVAKNGILTKAVVDKAGVVTSVENQLFDSETGGAILTRVRNEFGKSIYDYNYPAHQYYDGMGGAYNNLGATYVTNQYSVLSDYEGISNVVSTGYIKENSGDIFFLGDELEIRDADNKFHSYWVIDKEELNDPLNGTLVKVILASEYGTTSVSSNPGGNNSIDIRVVRSGKRNHFDTSAGMKKYMEGAHKLSDLLNTELPLGATITISESDIGSGNPIFTSPHLIECNDISPRIGVVKVFVEDSHTLSFNFYNGITFELSSKAFVEFSNEINLLETPYKEFDTYQFIKEEDVMHVQVLSNTENAEYIKATWNDPEDVFPSCELILNATAIEYYDGKWDIPYQELPDQHVADYTLISDNNANSYGFGKLGVWRPRKGYTYLTDRVQSSNGGAYKTNIAKDGYFDEFTEFDWSNGSQNDINWRWVAESTKISPYGFELESKNPLGQYSSAMYGYNGALPVAIAQNTEYSELAYTGFEDVDANDIISGSGSSNYMVAGHWNLSDSQGFEISSEESHTGKNSLKFTPSTAGCDTNGNGSAEDDDDNYGNGVYFYFNPSDVNSTVFDPQPEQKYIVSAWVKVKDFISDEEDDDNTVVVEPQKDNGTSYENIGTANSYWSETPLIEGWKKLEVVFTLSSNENQNYRIRFSGRSCDGESMYIDDIRMSPADGAMTSYVYDRNNLRLTAVLDGYNYATFYDYDDAGALIQVKKESVNGIKTIQTNRSNTFKTNSVE